jgi:hypothetical protein
MAGQVDTDADAIGGARATGWFDERRTRPLLVLALVAGLRIAIVAVAPPDGLAVV